MKVDLNWDEREVLEDLLTDEIRRVKRGESVYGDAEAQAERLGLLRSIDRKIGD